MKLISSWSGGKDSCLALHRAVLAGHSIDVLLNFISDEYKRCCFHGTGADLMFAQADALGFPMFQKSVPADMDAYEYRFKSAVTELREKYKTDGMVFGDVYLLDHQSWVERVCKDLDITPLEPLWNLPAEKVVEEFIDSGFRAIVISAKADVFGEDFIGREIDHELIREIKKQNVCPCGENGEFHSFVFDGPIFKKKIVITDTGRILKEGFWKHWFLDIREFRVEEK